MLYVYQLPPQHHVHMQQAYGPTPFAASKFGVRSTLCLYLFSQKFVTKQDPQ